MSIARAPIRHGVQPTYGGDGEGESEVSSKN